jgi:multisubunit Na+/H+ antiporter MnhG subunit
MDAIVLLVLILIGAVLVFFSAVGLAFLWVVREAHKIMDKQTRD